MSLISPSFNVKDYIQTLGRVHRAGAKTPVVQRILVASKTIEEKVLQVLEGKRKSLEVLHAKPPDNAEVRHNQNETMNAKKELLEHIEYREVKYVRAILERSYDNRETIEGTLDEVLPKLDFDYDSGYGSQYMEGVIWYSDGTWSERGEYDGSEWWEHRECPSLPNETSPSVDATE
jgi:CRISPR/Cas system-associated endonuclease/helicase Cas3